MKIDRFAYFLLGICEKVLKQRPYVGNEYEEDSESLSSDESFEIRGKIRITREIIAHTQTKTN